MPDCIQHHRRHRVRHHRRMPTIGRHRSSVTGSPLHDSLARFATAHGIMTTSLEKCPSPAGLHPLAHSVTGHLRRLYDELLKDGGGGGDGSGLLLPRKTFAEFVREVQGETTPTAASPSSCEDLSFAQFEHRWWAEYSAAKRPIYDEDKDLDKPISNYFISSSHNTYIEDGNQVTGEAKALQYKKVLESGCRCVEIDVWNGTEACDDDDDGCDDDDECPAASARTRTSVDNKAHWSLASMLSWIRTRTTSRPRGIRPKKSKASLRPPPPARARAIMQMTSESTSSLLKHEPRVCHAYATYAGDLSLHEAIPFRTACRTIRESAFANGNELPVIVSLEVHATGQQRHKMVDIMREEWGDLLLDSHLPGCDPDLTQPTLRDLKRKILVKARTGSQAPVNAPPCRDSSITTAGPDCDNSTLQDSQRSEYAASCDEKESSKPSSSSCCCSSSSSPKPQQHRRDARSEAPRKPPDPLRDLVIYTYSPGKFDSFRAPDSTKPAHIYSFGEETLKALHRTEHGSLFAHNRGYLARSFPESLSSFLSSNPNHPTLFWRKGVQMVALNWQVWDTAMELNDAMFDGEKGWVLKPPGYRSDGAGCQADVAGKKRLDLRVTVLAGQHIPAPDLARATRIDVASANSERFRPRVTCFLHVESAAERDPRKAMDSDDLAASRSTRIAQTEQPDWGPKGSTLAFPTARHVVEELSFVRFNVDHCGRMWSARTAWACIRLDRLQEGYRLIKLKTDDGYKSDGLLLVKIEKRVSEEPPVLASRRRRTWDVCRKEVSQLRSQWLCMK